MIKITLKILGYAIVSTIIIAALYQCFTGIRYPHIPESFYMFCFFYAIEELNSERKKNKTLTHVNKIQENMLKQASDKNTRK